MGFTVIPFGQGFSSMSPPTKELYKLVLEKKIAHKGHKVLRWMMDNAVVKKDPADNIKLDKAKSTEKIDGDIALVMALIVLSETVINKLNQSTTLVDFYLYNQGPKSVPFIVFNQRNDLHEYL